MSDLPEQTDAEVEAVMARWWDQMPQHKRDQWVVWGVIYAIGAVLNEMPGDEVDPDVAETAWAIIEHHAQQRTPG